MFPTNPGNVTARADANRGLQAWLWAMLVAPFVPWYTLPIPLIVFPFAWFVGLPAAIANGRPPPVTGLITSTMLVFLTLLLVITAFLSFFSVRRRAWQPAMWSTLANLACGATLLATFLLLTGIGPVEPLGFVSPLALLTLAAYPATFEVAGLWLSEIRNRSGQEAEQGARTRLLAVGVGYAVAFTVSVTMVAAWAVVALLGLGMPHFYSDEMAVRESAAAVFAVLGTVCLFGFLAASRLILRRWGGMN